MPSSSWSVKAPAKWVPVNRQEEEVAEPKQEKSKGEGKGDKGKERRERKGGEGGEKGSKKAKPQWDEEPKGSSKGESKRDSPKAEFKGGSKGDSKGASKGAKSSEGKGPDNRGKADWKGGSKAEPKADSRGDRGDWKGGKNDKSHGKDGGGGGKGKDKGGKSKSKGGGGKAKEPEAPRPLPHARNVQQVEDDLIKANVIRRSKDGSVAKQPIDAKGSHCEVHKHSGMGCAVISMNSAPLREAVMALVERRCGPGNPCKHEICGVQVQLRRHTDKSTQKEVVTDIFAAWGHKAEKDTPIGSDDICESFDKLAELAIQQAQAPQAHMQYAGAHQVPPPPAHYPAVGGQMAAHPQAQQHPAAHQAHQVAMMQQAMMYDYMRQSAMNTWYGQGAGVPGYGGGSPYGYPQQAAHPQAAQQHPGYLAATPQQGAQAAAAQPAIGAQAPAADGAPAAAAAAAAAGAVPGAMPSAGFAQSGYTPAKPKTLKIINPNSGNAIDVLGLNFEPRKPSSPLKIVNPESGDAINVNPESGS